MSKGQKFNQFIQVENRIQASLDLKIIPKLAPGYYHIKYNSMTKEIYFIPTQLRHDGLLDLPGTEYDTVLKELNIFLSDRCKKSHGQAEFLYKMSWLLHGIPGGGKTCISNRVAHQVVKVGGIVLINTPAALIADVNEIIDQVQPNQLVLHTFDELDEVIKRSEEDLLTVLDGEAQKDNVMYIATTNYIDRIPPRIRRPGRFASVIEVGYPSTEAREFYLTNKFEKLDVLKKKPNLVKYIVDRTNGFTIDELREVVRAGICLERGIDMALKSVKQSAGTGSASVEMSDEDEDEGYYDEDKDDLADELEEKKAKGSIFPTLMPVNEN